VSNHNNQPPPAAAGHSTPGTAATSTGPVGNHPHSSPQPPTPDSPPAAAPAWTADRIRALGTVTDVPTTAAIFRLSRSVAYDLIRTGAFPVPVLRFGSRYRVPVAAILTALHMNHTTNTDTTT
jgi:hypothetical protein